MLTPFGLGTLIPNPTASSLSLPKRSRLDTCSSEISTVEFDWGEAHLSPKSIHWEIQLEVVVFSEPLNGAPFNVHVPVDASISELKRCIAEGQSGLDPMDMLLCVKGKRLHDEQKVSECIGAVNSAGKFAPVLCIVDENPVDVFKTLLKIFVENINDEHPGVRKFKVGKQRRMQWSDALGQARHVRNLKNLLDSLESFIAPVCFKVSANWEILRREWMSAVRRAQSISELAVWFEYLARNLVPDAMAAAWNESTFKEWKKRAMKLAFADRVGLVALVKSCTLSVGDFLKVLESRKSSPDSEEFQFGISSFFFSSYQEDIMRLFRGKEFNLLSRIQIPSNEEDNFALSKTCSRYLTCVLENLAENDPDHFDLQVLANTQEFTASSLSQIANFILTTVETINEENFVNDWTAREKQGWKSCLQKVMELEGKYANVISDSQSPRQQSLRSNRLLFKERSNSKADGNRSLLRSKIRDRIRDLGSGVDSGFSRLISSIASSQQELESEENPSPSNFSGSAFRVHAPSLNREGSSQASSASGLTASSSGSRSVSDLARSLMLQDMMEILAMAEAEAASYEEDEQTLDLGWRPLESADPTASDIPTLEDVADLEEEELE